MFRVINDCVWKCGGWDMVMMPIIVMMKKRDENSHGVG
jgi:hypothetical protein